MVRANKLRENKLDIRRQYLAGVPVVDIAKQYDVVPTTMSTFISRHKLALSDEFVPPTYTEVAQRSLNKLVCEVAKQFPFKAYRYVAEYRVDNAGVAGVLLVYNEDEVSGLEVRRAISKLNAKQSMSIFILTEKQAKLFPEQICEQNEINLI